MAGVLMSNARRSRGGRSSKAGKRTPSGQLSRAGQPKGETLAGQPSAWVKAQRDKFGVHYCWALGRAYVMGLLGDSPEALNRYQAAKKFVRLYQRFYGGSIYTCPLDDSPRGGNVVSLEVPEHQENDRKWIAAAIDAMDVSGSRPYFDQLTSIVSIDRGPHWLDSMIAVIDWNAGLATMNAELRKAGKPALTPKLYHPADQMVLAAAIQALDIIAPEEKPRKILVSYY